MQREQFQSNLDSELHVWLFYQKPKNLSEAARLADQYVAVRKADRPIYKGHGSPSKGHVTKPKLFEASWHSNPSGVFQKSTSFGHNAKPHNEQKPSATSSAKFDHFLWRKRHLDYVSTVGNKVTECLSVPSDGQDKNWKMFQCS